MKECSRCKYVQPRADFYRHSRAKDGLQSWCKACSRKQEQQRAKRPTSPTARARQLNKNFKMTLEDYAELLAAQGGKCAICQSPRAGKRNLNFSVDHDHACCPGKETCGQCIRGLLCYPCNTALAHFGDNLEGIMRVVEYLILADSQKDHDKTLSPQGIGPVRHEELPAAKRNTKEAYTC